MHNNNGSATGPYLFKSTAQSDLHCEFHNTPESSLEALKHVRAPSKWTDTNPTLELRRKPDITRAKSSFQFFFFSFFFDSQIPGLI